MNQSCGVDELHYGADLDMVWRAFPTSQASGEKEQCRTHLLAPEARHVREDVVDHRVWRGELLPEEVSQALDISTHRSVNSFEIR